MIKNIIKKAIIMTLIINSILCFIYNFCNYINTQILLDDITSQTLNVSEMQTLTFQVQKGYDNYSFLKDQHYMGRKFILANNITISIFSLIIGIAISLITSMENSKLLRHLFIFISSNICWNIILTIIYSILSESIFINNFFMVLKNTFILYTLLFFIIILSRIFITKYQTKKINEILQRLKTK